MASKRDSKSAKHKSSEPSIDDNDTRSSPELKLPFTFEEKLFFATTVFIAIYEIVFWLVFDAPITLHSKGTTPIYALAISASLNSIPHLFCGAYGLLYITRSYKSAALLLITKYKQQRELKKKSTQHILSKHKKQLKALPVYQKGGVRFCIYLLYISLFSSMQIYFWWLPYFFGIVTDLRFAKMHKKLHGIVSILPPNDKYLVPSAEHTLLFPLTVLSWMLSIRMFLKYRAVIITQVRTRWANYALLVSFSATICYLPTSMANMSITKKDAKGQEITETRQDVGAAIIAAVIICANLLFFVAFFWSPSYNKAAQAQSKKKK